MSSMDSKYLNINSSVIMIIISILSTGVNFVITDIILSNGLLSGQLVITLQTNPDNRKH